ncbi:MAG: response regulator transcription factor [Planctomycetes bacterium]|nr:response regulator transcription factor [Planctomycetota bacterium]
MDANAPIQIFLVDDQSMIRAGIRSMLSKNPRFQVSGSSGDPRAAIEAIGKEFPDVILLDISMPGLSGIDAISQIRKIHPRAHIVMLTHHEGETFVEQALQAGADGYLSKDSDPAELALAIESVSAGRLYLSPKVAGVLFSRARGGPNPVALGTSRLQSLTPREREVFQLLALGKSNKEVAKVLGLSLGTAKKHRENLQAKLACGSAAELALLAIKEGMLSA